MGRPKRKPAAADTKPVTLPDDDAHLCLICGKRIHGLQAYVSHRRAGCAGPEPSVRSEALQPAVQENVPSSPTVSATSLKPHRVRAARSNRCEDCDVAFRSRKAYNEHMDLTHSSSFFTPSSSRAERQRIKRKVGFSMGARQNDRARVEEAEEDDIVSNDNEFGGVEASLTADIKVVARADENEQRREKEVGDWIYLEQDQEDQDETNESDEDGEQETFVDCPLCGPVGATGLAVHIFSSRHIEAYKVFIGRNLPPRYDDELISLIPTSALSGNPSDETSAQTAEQITKCHVDVLNTSGLANPVPDVFPIITEELEHSYDEGQGQANAHALKEHFGDEPHMELVIDHGQDVRQEFGVYDEVEIANDEHETDSASPKIIIIDGIRASDHPIEEVVACDFVDSQVDVENITEVVDNDTSSHSTEPERMQSENTGLDRHTEPEEVQDDFVGTGIHATQPERTQFDDLNTITKMSEQDGAKFDDDGACTRRTELVGAHPDAADSGTHTTEIRGAQLDDVGTATNETQAVAKKYDDVDSGIQTMESEVTNLNNLGTDTRTEKSQVADPGGSSIDPHTTEPEQSRMENIITDDQATSDITGNTDGGMADRVRSLILQGMEWSAPFAPFRCEPCRFTCNRFVDLKRHASSRGHWLRKSEKRCSLCGGDVVRAEHYDDEEHRSRAGQRMTILSSLLYNCGLCNATFRLKVAATHHMQRRHNTPSPFVCETCSSLLPEGLVPDHQASHGLPQRCENCGESMATTKAVERHYKSSTCRYPGNVRDAKFQCRHCEFRNDHQVHVLYHESMEHFPPQTNPPNKNGVREDAAERKTLKFFCPECKTHVRKAALKSHLMRHTGEAPYRCLYCSRYFYAKSECDRHEQMSHRRRQRRVDEEVSAAGSPRAPSVARVPLIALKCQFCELEFTSVVKLRMHMRRLHRNEWRSCPVDGCEFRAREDPLLRRHIANSHPDFKRFSCDRCDFTCDAPAVLEIHMHKHTGARPYRCQHCEFATRFPAHLKRHLRVHTGARPFPCPFCQYRANNFENLRKHVITTGRHKGMSLYMCKFCPENQPFETNRAREFKRHLRERHCGEFENVSALATYVAGVYNRDDDVIETDQPISHTYKQRSKTPKPKRIPLKRVRAADVPTTSAGPSGPTTRTMAIIPLKGYRSCRPVRTLPLLAPKPLPTPVPPEKSPSPPPVDADDVLDVVMEKESAEETPIIDYVGVSDDITLQMPPAVDGGATLGHVADHQFGRTPIGEVDWRRSRDAEDGEGVDDPDPADQLGPTRFSAPTDQVETPVPEVHFEDTAASSSVVHRTTLLRSSEQSSETEVISLETNYPTEITVVHSEETGDCSSLLMTFFTDSGTKHVMVPRDVIIHRPEEPVFKRIKVDFTAGEVEGSDKVTIHKFY